MEIEQTISSSAVQKATISYSPAVSSGHHSGERPRWSGHLIRADPCECPLPPRIGLRSLRRLLFQLFLIATGPFKN